MSDMYEQARLYLQISDMNNHGVSGFRSYVRYQINSDQDQAAVEADYHQRWFEDHPAFSFVLETEMPSELYRLVKLAEPYLSEDLVARANEQKGNGWNDLAMTLEATLKAMDIFVAACMTDDLFRKRPGSGGSRYGMDSFVADCDLVCQTAPELQLQLEKIPGLLLQVIRGNPELPRYIRKFSEINAGSEIILAQMTFAEAAEEEQPLPTQVDEDEAREYFEGARCDVPVTVDEQPITKQQEIAVETQREKEDRELNERLKTLLLSHPLPSEIKLKAMTEELEIGSDRLKTLPVYIKLFGKKTWRPGRPATGKTKVLDVASIGQEPTTIDNFDSVDDQLDQADRLTKQLKAATRTPDKRSTSRKNSG